MRLAVANLGADDGFGTEFSYSFGRGALCLALSRFPRGDYTKLSAEDLISLLRTDEGLKIEFARPANGFVDYSVGTHTAMAIGQRQKYGLGSDLPIAGSPHAPLLGEREIDCALLPHDLAKYLEGEKKNAHAEHARTMAFIKPYLPFLPVSKAQLAVVIDLIDNDSLGGFFMAAFPKRPSKDEKLILQDEVRTDRFDRSRYHGIVDRWTADATASLVESVHLEQLVQTCVSQFAARAAKLGLKPVELFDIQIAFFQADVSSYTVDAKAFGVQAPPALDYLFARNTDRTETPLFKIARDRARLEFAPAYEELYHRLRESVIAAS